MTEVKPDPLRTLWKETDAKLEMPDVDEMFDRLERATQKTRKRNRTLLTGIIIIVTAMALLADSMTWDRLLGGLIAFGCYLVYLAISKRNEGLLHPSDLGLATVEYTKLLKIFDHRERLLVTYYHPILYLILLVGVNFIWLRSILLFFPKHRLLSHFLGTLILLLLTWEKRRRTLRRQREKKMAGLDDAVNE